MPCLVTFGFLLYAACKRFGYIDSGLVCDAEKYPKDICYFFFDIIFFSLLKGLVAILARHNSCQFTYFFGQYGHIGELAEVTHSILLNPGVYFFLCFFQCDYSLFFVSMQMVTGPSFNNSTFMSAPNSPVPISLPNAKLNSLQNCSYSGIDISGFAARI